MRLSLFSTMQVGEQSWGPGLGYPLWSMTVAQRKWFWQFEHPAALIPLYRRYLIEGGAMEEDAVRFREMWLYYCRNLHVWDTEPIEWRGGCHRSMLEAPSKGLASK